jgi:hypothetical protein
MASSITEAQAELISSLAPDDIPIKLRCAICSKLAVNAFRLPCCEQAICETCQSNLPSSCPVCEHSPLSAEDCNPNKSLRTTIKVFLRTAEKKREAQRAKEAKDSAPPTPVEPARPQDVTSTEHTSVKTLDEGAKNGTSTAEEIAALASAGDPSRAVAQVDAQVCCPKYLEFGGLCCAILTCDRTRRNTTRMPAMRPRPKCQPRMPTPGTNRTKTIRTSR